MQKAKFGEDSQAYVFDLEHEQKRREQLEKLFGRTKEQIDEETYLIEELKKIEVRKKEREKKQQDVNKLLTAVVDYENNNSLQQQAKVINKQRGSIENRASLGGLAMANKRPKQRKFSTNSSSELNRSVGPVAGSQGLKQTVGQVNPNVSAHSNGSGNTSLNNSVDLTNQSPSQIEKDGKNRKSLIFKVFKDCNCKVQIFIFFEKFRSLWGFLDDKDFCLQNIELY